VSALFPRILRHLGGLFFPNFFSGVIEELLAIPQAGITKLKAHGLLSSSQVSLFLSQRLRSGFFSSFVVISSPPGPDPRFSLGRRWGSVPCADGGLQAAQDW